MWVKINAKDKETIYYIDKNKISTITKCDFGDEKAIIIDVDAIDKVVICRDTQAEIDQIIQAFIGDKTIKEVE